MSKDGKRSNSVSWNRRGGGGGGRNIQKEQNIKKKKKKKKKQGNPLKVRIHQTVMLTHSLRVSTRC